MQSVLAAVVAVAQMEQAEAVAQVVIPQAGLMLQILAS
jgi:hypothetical protein